MMEGVEDETRQVANFRFYRSNDDVSHDEPTGFDQNE
jgi:hypothetical protein